MVNHPRSRQLPIVVRTAPALRELVARLKNEPVIAVDTESNSLYAYRERVCLVQFSVPGHDFVVDPLSLDDLSPLGRVFGTPAVEKVFHAAEYDVMVLRRDYQFEMVNLFDTMLASRIVGWPRYGLGSLLEEHFDVRTNKRFQRTNWGRRPLSDDELKYARLDTHYLLALREKLISELQQQDRMEEAQAAFARVAQSAWTEKEFDPETFWRIKGAQSLNDESLAVLRGLYVYRDERARSMNRPPFKVFSDSLLVRLSRDLPQTISDLEKTKGVPRRLPMREKRRILGLIARGKQEPRPRREKRKRRRPDEDVLNRYDALKQWRKARARSRGVEPDVILPNKALRALAHHNPSSMEELARVGTLSEWERREYGLEVMGILAQV